MDKIIQIMQSHLIYSVGLLFSPVKTINSVLASRNNVSDSILIFLIIGFICMLLKNNASISGENIISNAAFMFFPIILFMISIKISWALARTNIEIETALSGALLLLSILSLNSSIIFYCTMKLVEIFDAPLYNWLGKNSFIDFAIIYFDEVEFQEKRNSNPAVKVIMVSGVVGFLVNLFYVFLFHKALGLHSGASSTKTYISLASFIILTFIIIPFLNVIM